MLAAVAREFPVMGRAVAFRSVAEEERQPQSGETERSRVGDLIPHSRTGTCDGCSVAEVAECRYRGRDDRCGAEIPTDHAAAGSK